jgi:hypothetical protein
MGAFISMWVDAEGIIRYFSPASRINALNINQLLKDGQVQELEEQLALMRKKKNTLEQQQRCDDKSRPFLASHGDTDSNYLFRFILKPYVKNLPYAGMPGLFSAKYSVPIFKAVNIPLINLLGVAFRPQADAGLLGSSFNTYGRFLYWPLLKVRDVSKFQIYWESKNADSVGMNQYCYELSFPDRGQLMKINQHIIDSAVCYMNPVKDTSSYTDFGFPTAHSIQMQQVMQQNLLNCFPYKVNIERIAYPAYYLVITGDKKQVKTKGGKLENVTTQWGVKFVNQSITELIKTIWFYNQFRGKVNKEKILDHHYFRETIILDRTDIDFNIDIDLNCKMDDWDQLVNELRQNGLDLVETQIKIFAIVIRDR